MELTKDDCVTMHNALSAIKQPEYADIKDLPDKEDYIFHLKFVYAISYNKRKLQDVVDSLQETSKVSKEYEEYLDKREKLLQLYAVKDETGVPVERAEKLPNGQVRRSYIVPDLSDAKSAASKAIDGLEKKYKAEIELREKQQEDFKNILKEKPDEIKLKKIKSSMLPKGLQPSWMDGLIYMLEDEPE